MTLSDIEKYVKQIKMSPLGLTEADRDRVLRSLVLEIYCDGKRQGIEDSKAKTLSLIKQERAYQGGENE